MTDASESGAGGGAPHATPPAAAEPPPARGPLARWFDPVHVPRGAPAQLRELSSKGSLVFVMRSAGLLNFLYLRWFLRRHGLPPLRAAQGFLGFFGWVARVRRSRGAFRRAVARGDSAVVFLGRPVPRDPFATLVRQARKRSRPVTLVPVLLVWSRRAQKLKPSIWDVLFGSPEAPSAFASAIAFLRSYRRAFFVVGRPLDLPAVLAERPHDPDALLARKLRGALRRRLAREFRTVVGPPLKAPSRVREKVLRDRTLRATIDAVAGETGRAREAVLAQAQKDLREIASHYDVRFVQVMRLILTWAFARLYKSVEVDEEGLARLKRAAGEAPVVLCPSHKSHVDYLVISWLLYGHGMTPPHIGAGINLAFWPFGAIARRGGAFFIRRKVKGDRVYTAVLRAYVKHLLRDRFPQEFYIEGGRSRTGKLLFPKTGLVSMEVDAWIDGAADDVLFVPVAVDYEKLIEASSYAKELAGGEKKKESLRGLLVAAGVLLRRYDRLYVRFGEPISLRSVAEERLGPRAAALSLEDVISGEAERAAPAVAAGTRRAPDEEKRRLVQALGNRIAYGIGCAATITPVGLLSAALLSHVKRGLGAGEVARRVELLRYAAAESGASFARDLAGAPSSPLGQGPIADALRRLAADGAVRVAVAAGETIFQVVEEKRPLLDYHRNAVIHRYVGPALVAAAARASGAAGPTAQVRERVLWLSRLFKLEFMYRVGASFDEIFEEHLGFLVRIGALAREGDQVRAGEQAWALDFLAELTRTYLEGYRLAAQTALRLTAPHMGAAERRVLVKEALERGRAAFLSGEIALRESLSKTTIENAVEWFMGQGILSDEAGKLTVRDPPALRALVDQITLFLAA